MERPLYLSQLVRKQHNGMIKVITGVRRSGKSFLLFELFYAELIKQGVSYDHIIRIALDDIQNKDYLDPDILYYQLNIEQHKCSRYHMRSDSLLIPAILILFDTLLIVIY